MDETLIPPLLEYDTLYMYHMDKAGDDSGVSKLYKTIGIINVEIKNMFDSSESGHALVIDFGVDKIHINSEHLFVIE